MQRGGAYALFFFFTALIIVFLPAIPPAHAKTRVEVSIFMPDAGYDISELTNFQSQLGVKFTAAKWYQDWGTNFDPTVAQTFHTNGFIPEMTWEPEVNNTGVAFNDVTSGQYDGYITQTAQAVAKLGYPIRISLAPEMNTNWTPWGLGLQGNTPQNFIAFWRYVVQKFRDNGATNVSWIWSPNVIPDNAQQLYGGNFANLYPGDNYVDYMGLDGYNWGTSQSWSVWQSFSDVFGASYQQLTNVSGKKILLMEVASAEAGGSKAGWITDMFSQLQNYYPQIAGFTWFDINKETDWRINSSAAATAAFTSGYLAGTVSVPVSGPAIGNSGSAKASSAAPATSGTTANSNPAAPSAPTANLPVNQKYSPTEPFQPKIAGTIVAASAVPYQFDPRTLSALLLLLMFGVTGIAWIIWRRHQQWPKLGHNAVVSWSGLGKVDSVFVRIAQIENR